MKKFIKILPWLLVIGWGLLIFFLSSMNAYESNNKSEGTITKIIEKGITSNKTIDKEVTHNKANNYAHKLNYPMRKIMHYSVYFILALLLLIALRNNKYNVFIVLIICFLYALTDEYHQTFINGRTGQFTDVLIDTFGALTCILIYLIVKKIANKSTK